MSRAERQWVLILFLTAVLAATGCATRTPLARAAPASAHQVKNAEFSPLDLQRIAQNCPFGLPKTNPKWTLGPTRYIARDGYVLQHSSLDKIPLWVCEHVTKEQLHGSATRSGKFAPDPLLAGQPRAELADYRGSGYDRGHQAPAGDFNADQRLKDETFYLSNMAPQVPALNQQAWADLEDRVRDCIESFGGGYIITGGFFYDAKEDDPQTADGAIDYWVTGPHAVAVPTHFYKIVVVRDAGGSWQATAFVMENRAYHKPYHFDQYVKSVDWVEEHTGLDFMPDLDPLEEQRLEGSPAALWPCIGND